MAVLDLLMNKLNKPRGLTCYPIDGGVRILTAAMAVQWEPLSVEITPFGASS
jgi:hypothetical protein